MFVIRSVEKKDIDDLFALSQTVFFINLPADRAIIEQRIESSIKSFTKPSKNLAKNYYLFVLEDLETNKVLGISMIHAQHGTEEEPHFYLRVGQEHKFSSSINTGFILGTLELGWDSDGPTEIGGIVLDRSFRGHADRLGRQLSLARFLFMGIHPTKFKKMIHSELMPPLDKNGKSPLWEAVGRKFLNMDYYEADTLSRTNKEFILSLFPSENIYINLLPLEARDAIGKVGPETLGVKKLLKSIGFKYIHEVDPFDGGPHYRCALNDVKPVKTMGSGQLKLSSSTFDPTGATEALVSLPAEDGKFLAIKSLIHIDGNSITLPSEITEKLKLENLAKIQFITLDY